MATEMPAVGRSSSTLAEKETVPEFSLGKICSSGSPGLEVKSLHRRDQVLIRQLSQDIPSTITCPHHKLSTRIVAASCQRQFTQELTALHSLPLRLVAIQTRNMMKITKQLSFENTRRKRSWWFVLLYWLFFLLRQQVRWVAISAVKGTAITILAVQGMAAYFHWIMVLSPHKDVFHR